MMKYHSIDFLLPIPIEIVLGTFTNFNIAPALTVIWGEQHHQAKPSIPTRNQGKYNSH